MANVEDIAAYILDQQGSATTWELQKLVYYANGWSLAWDGVALLDGSFEAWKHGPVSRRLFGAHAGRHRLVRGELVGDVSRLSATQRDTIDAVLSFYGELGAEALVELSHRERPWIAARAGLDAEARSSAPLDPDAIRDYFTRLAGVSSGQAKRIPDEVRRGVRFALEHSESELEESDDDVALTGVDADAWLAELCRPAS